MEVRSHKSKHYGWFALKVFILAWAFWFLFQKVTSLDPLSFDLLLREFQDASIGLFILFLGLAIANWTFEILKWQTLVSWITPLSFKEAVQQSLAALTVSLPTPNRLGDYGAKAFFFPAKQRKKIIFLNFLGHSAQMTATLCFGICGWWFFPVKNTTIPILPVFWVGLALLFIGAIMLYLYRKQIKILKGWRLDKAWSFFLKIPSRVKGWTLVYSFVRYVIFSTMFFGLLLFFGAEITIWNAFPMIAVMYLLTSIIPTFVIWDVVVKGGIAVWLFGLLGIPEMIVLTTVFTMWFLNMAIPALIGTYFFLKIPVK